MFEFVICSSPQGQCTTIASSGSYLSKPASTGFWQPWWDMFTPPYSMPFYRQETELLLLFGSYEFQELGRMLFWPGPYAVLERER